LFWHTLYMDLIQSATLSSVMTLVSAYLVALVNKSVKFVLIKCKVARERENAVSREVAQNHSEVDDGKMSQKEKEARILLKRKEIVH
ncbi:hypothetical protein H920_04578, partial [Fukomys damarensis]